MEYLLSLKRLEKLDSPTLEAMSGIIERDYIKTDITNKYKRLCDLFSKKNKCVGVDVTIMCDEDIYDLIFYATGIGKDLLKVNNKNISIIDGIEFFNRFNTDELLYIIGNCNYLVSEEVATEIENICFYLLSERLDYISLEYDFEYDNLMIDSNKIESSIKIYTDNFKKVLSL